MLKIIAAISAMQVVAVLVSLLRSKIMAVLLGPQGVGVVGLVDQLVQLVLYLSTLSLPFAAVRYMSRAHSEGPESFRRTYGALLRALILPTTGVAILASVAVLIKPELLGTELSDYWLYLIPALVAIPAMASHGLFTSVLAAAGRARESAILALGIALSLALAAVVGIQLSGIFGLYVGNLVATVVVAITVAVYLRRKLGLPLLDRTAGLIQELRHNPDILSFSVTVYISTLAGSATLLVSRYVILASYGEVEAGLLQVGLTMFASLRLVLGPANGLYLTPIVNRRIPKLEKIKATLEFERKFFVVVLLLAMPMVLFPQWLIHILFSPAFLPMSSLVGLFVLAQCIQLMGGVFHALLIGVDDMKAFGVSNVLGLLLTSVGAWLLAPVAGIGGVAASFVAGSLVTSLIAYWQLRAHGMSAPALWWLGAGYGLGAVLLGSYLGASLDAWQLWAVAVRVVVAAAFAATLLTFLSRGERMEVFRLIRHWVARGESVVTRRSGSRSHMVTKSLPVLLLLALTSSCNGDRAAAIDVQPGPVSITVDTTQMHQTMDGFGATTEVLASPFMNAGADSLTPSQRQRAIQAVYGDVGITLGTLPALLEGPGSYDDRRNDNDDPNAINWAGFNPGSARLAKDNVIDPARALRDVHFFLGPTVNTHWASPWLAQMRSSDYRRYIAEATEQVLATQLYYRDTLGFTPRLHMLFNEPISGNGELLGGKDQDVVDIVKSAGAALRQAGFAEVKFILPSGETTADSLRTAEALLQDADARQYVGVLAYHSYPYGSTYASVHKILDTSGSGHPDPSATTVRKRLRDLAAQYGLPVWMTEVSHGEVDANAYDNFRARALHIHDELQYADACAYFGMTSMWDMSHQQSHFGGSTDLFSQDGSIVLIHNPRDAVYITGMGRAIGQYARWVLPGSVRVQADSSDPLVAASAFRNDASQTMVLVLINNDANPRQVQIGLNGTSVSGPGTGEQSTPDAYWRPLQDDQVAGGNTIELQVPGLSVTSLAFALGTTAVPREQMEPDQVAV